MITQAINGYLAYGGATSFYSASVPPYDVQEAVYTTVNHVAVSFKWQTL